MLEKLNAPQIEIIEEHVKPRLYNTETEIIYEGQVPNVGYLIISGSIHLSKRKKIIKALQPGELIGVGELLNNHTFPYTCTIEPGSTVCILDKSTIYELMQEIKDHEVIQYFQHDIA
jgi:CRP-like cAMP-binding protein